MACIRPLPAEVAAQIKASANINSLNDVVRSLLENSLDADATKIIIKIDYSRGSCWIQDDGNGISRADLEESGGLGKPYQSSNIGDPRRLGKNGCFLSSISAVCILNIVSRRGSDDANAIMLHHGQSPVRYIPAPEHMSSDIPNSGTKVIVHDLFGNLPVRVKQRPIGEEGRGARDKDWSTLCRTIAGVLLACGQSINLSLKGTDPGHVLTINSRSVAQTTSKINTALTKSLLRQALRLDTTSDWIQTSARTMNMTIRALISLEPSPDRKSQFICLGPRYMAPGDVYEPIYEAINRVFFNSCFGNMENSPRKRRPELGPKARQLRGSRKGLDRWPMFVLHVNNPEECVSEYDSKLVTVVSDIVVTMMTSFLIEHGFGPRKSLRRSDSLEKSQEQIKQPVILRPASTPQTRDAKSVSRRPISKFRETIPDLARCKIEFPILKSGQVEIAGKDDTAFRSRFMSSRSTRPASSNIIVTLPIVNGSRPTISVNSENVVARAPCISQPGSKADISCPFVERESEEDAQQEGTMSQPIDTVEDEFIDWIDPKSRRTLRLNTRTGCVMYDEGKRRSSTTGSSSSTINQKTKPLPRLVRSSHGIASPKQGSWAQEVLTAWQNPVFEAAEDQIRSIQVDAPLMQNHSLCRHDHSADGTSPEDGTTGQALKMSRAALQTATVISQVDSKFILVKTQDEDQELVVLIDQHASDERVKLEKLLQEICSKPDPAMESYLSPLGHKSAINTTLLDPPMFFDLQFREYAMFKKAASRFAQWGILYDIAIPLNDITAETRNKTSRLIVLTLPECIAQRCKVEPATLIQILRGEAYQYNDGRPDSAARTVEAFSTEWTQRIHNCPQGILDLLNSRACRSAIMFNDYLSLNRCKELVADLAKCKFPFQCAHGRPSMVPLLTLGGDLMKHPREEEQNISIDLQHWLDDH